MTSTEPFGGQEGAKGAVGDSSGARHERSRVGAPFQRSPPSQLVPAWQSGRLRLVLSADILEEYLGVLAYPKFKLTDQEIRGLIEEDFMRFIQAVAAEPTTVPALRDPEDLKFVACAKSAHIRWLVSGEDDLLSLKMVGGIEIVSVTTFLKLLKRKPYA